MKNAQNSKKIIALVVVIALVIALIPVVALAAGDTTGEITVTTANSAPIIDSVVITELANGTAAVDSGLAFTEFTPQEYYEIAITVTDSDTIADIDMVGFQAWYTTTPGDPTDEHYGTVNSAISTSTIGPDEGYAFLWMDDSPGSFTAMASTWNAVTTSTYMIEPTDSADRLLTTYTYKFRFQVGKAALECTGSDTDKWVFAVYVGDDTGVISNEDYFLTSTDYVMNWYGEVNVPVDYAITFTDVLPGQPFSDPNHRSSTLFDTDDLNCISNGGHNYVVSADAIWNEAGAGTGTITMDNTGDANDANEFALAIDSASTYAVGTAIPLVDSANAQFLTGGNATDESGININNYYLYIKANSTFPEGKTFEGTISFGLVND